MKSVTIIAEQISDRVLAGVLPTRGIASVVVTRHWGPRRADAEIENYQALRNPMRFNPNYRIDLLVDEAALESVFDGVSFAYGAGLFSDAEMWVNRDAPAAAA